MLLHSGFTVTSMGNQPNNFLLLFIGLVVFFLLQITVCSYNNDV